MSDDRHERIHMLLIQLKNGSNVEAADQLYKLTFRDLDRYADSLRCPYEDPNDSVNETFAKIIKNRKQYNEPQKGGLSWMKAILHNHVVTVFIRHGRVGPLPDDLPGRYDPDSDSARCARQALAALTSEERVTIEREAPGSRVGEGPGTTTGDYRRAAKKLRKLYDTCMDASPRHAEA